MPITSPPSAYDATADLPAETVTTEYNTLGVPTTETGLANYVGAAVYDDRGRPGIFGYGAPAGGDFSMGRYWSYDGDQRLQTATTAGHGGQLVAEHTLGYDANGNITQNISNLNGNEFRECYTYDDRNRLTLATTTADVTSSNACASAPSTPTGDLAYRESYTYSSDGNLTSRTQGGSTLDYTFPTGTDPEHPHAPTDVEGDTYEWDANGQLESRTVDGDTTTFGWNAERHIETITSDAGTARFTYDPDGQRLLHQAPDGDRTLYIEGHEITANSAGTTVHATRAYSFGGELIATRTATGVHYVGVNQQSSIETQIPAGSATADAEQAYTPYGNQRTSDDFGTQRGWIGQVEDDDTGLNYLNARYYDPNLGTFISPDPVIDPGQPSSINPYAYGLGNPTTNSDPTGLWIPINAHGTHGGYNPRIPSTAPANVSGISTAHKVFYNSYVSTSGFQRDVNARRGTCWCLSSWANPLVQIAGMPRNVQRALIGINNLHHMHLANDEPGFWQFIAAVKRGCRGCTRGELIDRGRSIQRTSQLFRVPAGGSFLCGCIDWGDPVNLRPRVYVEDPDVTEAFLPTPTSPACDDGQLIANFVEATGCYAPAPDPDSFMESLGGAFERIRASRCQSLQLH